MLRNYFKTTYRYLKEHKLFTFINLFGLATALCAAYFAILYINFELSYDSFNVNKDRIYRISTDVMTAQGINRETSAAPLANALETTFPEVEKSARVFLDYYIVQKDNDLANEETLAYADPAVFSIFSFPLLKGNAATVFNAPYNMVLSETAAKKYFGTTDCIGKTLTLDGHITAAVTGIMKDIPRNSHFRTDILLSMSSLIYEGSSWMTTWGRFGFSTYVLLKEHAGIAQLEKKFPAFVKQHPLKEKTAYKLIAEPLQGLYLHGSQRGNKAGATVSGNEKNIYIFSVVAVFVLLIACFNFINLTTAFSLKRAKEIGVRKVAGATRKQLIIQFLADSVTLSVLAFFVSLLLCTILLPWFNTLAGKAISTGLQEHVDYILKFFALTISVGLLSGLYPAFFLSSFQPAISLKGNSTQSKGAYLRKSLVVFQFTISIVLIIATVIVFRQLNFMQNEELGFNKEHNLVIDYHYDERITNHADAVKARLMEVPGVSAASLASCIPGRPNKTFLTTFETADNRTTDLQADGWYADDDFLHQYGIKVIAGRGFSKNYADSFGNMVLNEAAVKKLGFSNPQDAIGKRTMRNGNTGVIIGVVKDFHFHSAHEAVQPLTIQLGRGFFTFLTLTIKNADPLATVSQLQKKWKQIAPGLPMIYYFADETYNAQYAAEKRFGQLFTCFALLAIIISCLGLLGLVSFNTAQRTKEIGIRKVLGASVPGIVQLLSKDFLKLILIAFVIAIPVALYFMQRWLEGFAYRVQVSWWIFLVAGAIAFFIAMITISFQSIKAAIANPVKSLRTE